MPPPPTLTLYLYNSSCSSRSARTWSAICVMERLRSVLLTKRMLNFTMLEPVSDMMPKELSSSGWPTEKLHISSSGNSFFMCSVNSRPKAREVSIRVPTGSFTVADRRPMSCVGKNSVGMIFIKATLPPKMMMASRMTTARWVTHQCRMRP